MYELEEQHRIVEQMARAFCEKEIEPHVERLFGSLKDRVKVMRGFKSSEKAETLLAGWFIHHEHVRKARNNKWLQLIRESSSLINLLTRLIFNQNQPLI